MMIKAERAIREALEAGPTPGPWYIRTNKHPDTDGRAWGWLDSRPPGGSQCAPSGLQVTWERGCKSEINAAYVAACNPENIAALLAEIDRLTRELASELEMRERTAESLAAEIARADTAEQERNEAREERDALAKDAAIGRAVWRFIDRMTDVCDTDPAERIVREFVNAVYPAIEAALPRRPNHAPE